MGKTRKYEPETGRNKELAAQLRGRPNGFLDPRPRKQRTRKDTKRSAIRSSMEG